MHLPAPRSQRTLTAVLVLLLAATAISAQSPWSALDELRASIRTASPLSARFVQTLQPAGFGPEDGDREEGSLAISLPHCLRWDYSPPFEKSFLLCESTAYFWQPDESVGQRYPIGDQETPGLDFFLLSSEELQLRYNARSERAADGELVLHLEPIAPSDDVVSVEVTLSERHDQLLHLAYTDVEGNLTTFSITDYQKGSVPGRFTPPAELTWEDP